MRQGTGPVVRNPRVNDGRSNLRRVALFSTGHFSTPCSWVDSTVPGLGGFGQFSEPISSGQAVEPPEASKKKKRRDPEPRLHTVTLYSSAYLCMLYALHLLHAHTGGEAGRLPFCHFWSPGLANQPCGCPACLACHTFILAWLLLAGPACSAQSRCLH